MFISVDAHGWISSDCLVFDHKTDEQSDGFSTFLPTLCLELDREDTGFLLYLCS